MAEKSIKDKVTRILVILGACAGLCYNAIWYFPILMLIGGLTTAVWDIWLQQQVGKLRARLRGRKDIPQRIVEESIPSVSIALENLHQPASSDTIQRRAVPSSSKDRTLAEASGQPAKQGSTEEDSESGQTHQEISQAADTLTYAIPVKWGISIIIMFLGKTYRPYCQSEDQR